MNSDFILRNGRSATYIESDSNTLSEDLRSGLQVSNTWPRILPVTTATDSTQLTNRTLQSHPQESIVFEREPRDRGITPTTSDSRQDRGIDQGSFSRGIQHHQPISQARTFSGFEEVDRSSARRAILVMGATGAGKSSFVATVTGASVMIGTNLRSCTTECRGFDYAYGPNLSVTLVDTPGFDDFERPEMQVLDSIVRYIKSDPLLQVIGVIYMHRITDKRITGTSRLNLRMMRALCGEHYFQNVVLTTTMWNTIPTELLPDLKKREAELNQSAVFWGDMIKRGSKYIPHSGSPADGRAIVEVLLKTLKAPQLNIIIELGDGRDLESTTAGQILVEELVKREAKKRQELQEEQDALEEEKIRLKALITEAGRRSQESDKKQPARSRASGSGVAGHIRTDQKIRDPDDEEYIGKDNDRRRPRGQGKKRENHKDTSLRSWFSGRG